MMHELLGLLDLGGLGRFGITLDAAGGKGKRKREEQERGFHECHPFSSLSQRFASRFTFVGEVPPKLTREATEDSTVSTL
jgi:hypothetical protein